MGVHPVRELLGVVTSRRADGAVLATSGSFTPDALDFARHSGVELLDGPALDRFLRDVKKLAPDAPTPVAPSAPAPASPVQTQSAQTPACPQCADRWFVEPPAVATMPVPHSGAARATPPVQELASPPIHPPSAFSEALPTDRELSPNCRIDVGTSQFLCYCVHYSKT